jgi:hypothetical protein
VFRELINDGARVRFSSGIIEVPLDKLIIEGCSVECGIVIELELKANIGMLVFKSLAKR